MSEDDTFLTLKRVPFNQVLGEWLLRPSIDITEWEEATTEFFAEYGWTVQDFVDAYAGFNGN